MVFLKIVDSWGLHNYSLHLRARTTVAYTSQDFKGTQQMESARRLWLKYFVVVVVLVLRRVSLSQCLPWDKFTR